MTMQTSSITWPLVIVLMASSLAVSLPTNLTSGRLYVRSSDEMGVWNCTMETHTNEFPELLGKIRPTQFHLNIWIRYLMPGSSGGRPEMKVLVFAEPLADSFKIMESSQTTPLQSISIDPKLELHLSSNYSTAPASAMSANGGARDKNIISIKLDVDVKFQVSPVTKKHPPRASTSSRIPLDSAWAAASRHEYGLKALGGGPGKECSFRPLGLLPPSGKLFPKSPAMNKNTLKSANSDEVSSKPFNKGSEDQTNVLKNSSTNRNMLSLQAAVIAKPIWPMDAVNMALIDRHIQHYVMLGFSR